MAIELKSTTIGDTTYIVTMLGAKEGKRVGARLGRVLAGAAKEGEDGGMAALMANLKDEDLDYLCDKFAANTAVKMPKGEPQLDTIFDIHFAGKYGQMVKWLQFCVEVNFGSFLGELGLKLPEGQAPKAE